jgi:hypothetical protein
MILFSGSMRQHSYNRDQSDPTRISMGGASSKISRFASRKRDRMNTLEFSERNGNNTVNNSQKRISGIGAGG